MNLDLAQLLNPYDLIFLLVILVSFIFGVKNGLIKSLLNLIKWIVIFYLITLWIILFLGCLLAWTCKTFSQTNCK